MARDMDRERLPGSVLFACTLNAFRSPMAEAIMKRLHGRHVFIDSCGVRPESGPDPFTRQVMEEIGIDLSGFRPKSFADIQDSAFDLIITLSPEAHHHAMELTRTNAVEVEYWPTMDPSAFTGSREQILEGYRLVRDTLQRRILERFGRPRLPAEI
jgi:protein-tyrosine-phosphatase